LIKASPSRELQRRPPQRGTRPRKFKEGLIRVLCLLCALISIFTTFGIVYVLLREAIYFFREVSPLTFFFTTDWAPTYSPPKFGVVPLITGTLMITVGSGLIAIPLGLMAGLYLSEYARPSIRNILKPVLEILAGIPTVVYGFFGIFFVTPMLQRFIPGVQVYNAAAGAIVVGIMILPLVASLCEDALSAVPKSLREGAYGLGATKFEVSTKIVVPAALSGIMASFILALSRAIGETMAVTLAAGMNPNLTFDPRESIQTMTSFIVQISKGDTPAGTTAYYTLFAVGLTLFAMTMFMNFIAIKLVKRYRQVYQ
jgi:phosphate transport system permease protein